MPPVGFEATPSMFERPKTVHAAEGNRGWAGPFSLTARTTALQHKHNWHRNVSRQLEGTEPFRPVTNKNKQTPWPLVRERTIPTDRPPLVDEI
jgi:hypothetical protein